MANITMSVDQITEIVSKLQKSSNEIESIWNSINSTEIPKIREAWSGKDSEAYISKLKEVDALEKLNFFTFGFFFTILHKYFTSEILSSCTFSSNE